MSTGALFQITFYLAAPFWALMILAPRWSWTPRIMASPWVALLPLVIYLWFAVPHFGELWRVVSRPELDALRAYLERPYGAALIWAQLIAFDLFLGRWMYLQGRARGISAWLVGPILLLTIFLSPLGLAAFLAVRDASRGRNPLPATRAPARAEA